MTDYISKDALSELVGEPIEVFFKRLDLTLPPTVEAEPKWIPVTERLPDDLAEVNVTWVNRNPTPYYAVVKDVPFTGTAVYYNGKWYWYSAVCVDYLKEYGVSTWDIMDKGIEVTAWMPLPKPLAERKEEWQN